MAHWLNLNKMKFHLEDKTDYMEDRARLSRQEPIRTKWKFIENKQGLLTLDQKKQRDHELKMADMGVKAKSKYSWN